MLHVCPQNVLSDKAGGAECLCAPAPWQSSAPWVKFCPSTDVFSGPGAELMHGSVLTWAVMGLLQRGRSTEVSVFVGL